jgi:hypothetical protein
MGSVLGTTGGMLLDKNLWQGIKPLTSEKRCLVDKVRTDFCFRYETLLLKTRKKVGFSKEYISIRSNQF